MATRVQVVTDEVEREAFRHAAAREGISLSDWLRRAARERLRAAAQARLCSADDLRAFFHQCSQRERGDEPEWLQHRAVIEEFKGAGGSRT